MSQPPFVPLAPAPGSAQRTSALPQTTLPPIEPPAAPPFAPQQVVVSPAHSDPALVEQPDSPSEQGKVVFIDNRLESGAPVGPQSTVTDADVEAAFGKPEAPEPTPPPAETPEGKPLIDAAKPERTARRSSSRTAIKAAKAKADKKEEQEGPGPQLGRAEAEKTYQDAVDALAAAEQAWQDAKDELESATSREATAHKAHDLAQRVAGWAQQHPLLQDS